MKKKRLFILSFLTVLFISSCSKDRTMVIPENIKKYNVEDFDLNFFQWNEIVDEIEIIPLETTENSFLGDITKVEINGNDIFIYDRKLQTLLNFDVYGKFIKKIGQRGPGSTEYREIRDFCLFEDNIYTLDYRKIHSYDKAGVYIENLLFNTDNGFNPISFVAYSKENFFLWCSNPDVWDAENTTYYRMKDIEKGKIKSEYFKFEYPNSDDSRFYPCGNNSHYIKPIEGENIIYKQIKDSVVASFAIDFGEYAISPKQISELKEDEERNAYLKSDYFKDISDIFETTDYIFLRCTGPKSYSYDCIIDKKNNNIKLGRWDYKRSPYFFYSDGKYLYGYYEPYKILENEFNRNDLNTCFNEVFYTMKNIDVSDNFILVKVLLK